MASKFPADFVAGDEFVDPDGRFGLLRVVCPMGQCDDDNRPESVHVRMVHTGAEFFQAMYTNEQYEVLA